MSFSKAKILRFNEIKSCGPSPSKYNVFTKNKANDALLGIGRFADTTESQTSDCGSVSGSTKSVPIGSFQTPSMLRRKKTLTSSAKKVFNPKELFSKGSKSSESETLREKIIECDNKTQCIRELSQDIEDLKLKLCEINTQKTQLLTDKSHYEDKIQDMMSTHKKELLDLENSFETKMNDIYRYKQKLEEDLKNIKQEHMALRETNQHDLDAFLENIKELKEKYKSVDDLQGLMKEKESQIKDYEKKVKLLEKKYEEEIEIYKNQIDQLKREHQNEIQEIEFEMLKTMTELQKEKETSLYQLEQIKQKVQQDIVNLQEKHKNEKQQIVLEYENQLKTFSHNYMEIEKVENFWKEKLKLQEEQSDAILKECQAISEYNIIQCEVEKNNIKSSLETSNREYAELKERYDSLIATCGQLKYKCVSVENLLEDVKAKYSAELQAKDKQLKQKMAETKTYQITIHNSQETIEVLKKRLINSDRDVEQLKEELVSCEQTILELEMKCAHLNSELKQTQMASDELEMQFESSVKLNESEINKIRNELINKVDYYKNEVIKYSEQINEEKILKNEVVEQLNNTVALVNKINDKIELIKNNYEEKFKKYQTDIKLKEKQVATMTIDMEEMERRCNLLEKECAFYKNKCIKQEEEVKDNIEAKNNFNEQCKKYDDLLQKFENVVLENNELKNEYKKLAEENKGFNKKNNVEFEQKLNAHIKANEKLKKENADLRKYLKKHKVAVEDKENIGSPNRSSPFRERN